MRIATIIAVLLLVSVISSGGCKKKKLVESDPPVVQTNFAKGADIGWITEMEAAGKKFYNAAGVETEGIALMKSLGMNTIRLRVWVNPTPSWNNAADVVAKAVRAKNLGMRVMIDFHYSDYWADPGKQYKPAAWKDLSFEELKKALYDYTKMVMEELKAQGTTPDMVQVGNEINHGIVWPDGNVANIDQTAQLINAGTAAVKAVDPTVQMMLHVALGGQNNESVFFIDNMLARGVHFDVIGQSYYPKWHGTLADLENNLNDLVRRYNKDVIVVEYSALKEEVNKIAFGLPNGRGKGTCIWEPLSTWEKFFDNDGKSNKYLLVYDELSRQFLKK